MLQYREHFKNLKRNASFIVFWHVTNGTRDRRYIKAISSNTLNKLYAIEMQFMQLAFSFMIRSNVNNLIKQVYIPKCKCIMYIIQNKLVLRIKIVDNIIIHLSEHEYSV